MCGGEDPRRRSSISAGWCPGLVVRLLQQRGFWQGVGPVHSRPGGPRLLWRGCNDAACTCPPRVAGCGSGRCLAHAHGGAGPVSEYSRLCSDWWSVGGGKCTITCGAVRSRPKRWGCRYCGVGGPSAKGCDASTAASRVHRGWGLHDTVRPAPVATAFARPAHPSPCSPCCVPLGCAA